MRVGHSEYREGGTDDVVFPAIYTALWTPEASRVRFLGLTLCTCEMGAVGDVKRLDKILSSLVDVEREWESSQGGAAFVPPLSGWAKLNTLQAQGRRVLRLSP